MCDRGRDAKHLTGAITTMNATVLFVNIASYNNSIKDAATNREIVVTNELVTLTLDQEIEAMNRQRVRIKTNDVQFRLNDIKDALKSEVVAMVKAGNKVQALALNKTVANLTLETAVDVLFGADIELDVVEIAEGDDIVDANGNPILDSKDTSIKAKAGGAILHFIRNIKFN